MVPLGSPLAAQFWNEEVESTRSLEAAVRSLPREPPPLAMVRGSKMSRSQQLLLLQRLLGLPFAPSLAPDCDSPGGLVVDRVIASTGGTNWWATLTGRLRAQRLFIRRPQKLESSGTEDAPKWHYAKRLLDKSLYALCMRTRLLLGANTSLSLKSEIDSLDRDYWNGFNSSTPWRINAKFLHKLRRHDVSVEAAWHERFMDREARYWDVPQAVSLDIASVGSNSGLYYRLGAHHSSGMSQNCCGGAEKEVPWGALPGTCAQAAVSFGKEIDIWKEDDKHFGRQLHKPYNLLAARPHVTLSGVIGGVLNASLGPRTQLSQDRALAKGDGSLSVSADAFGSLGLTAQFGLFQRFLFDHTKFGARLDLGGASSTLAAASSSTINSKPSLHDKDGQNGITFALSLQQQVLGPLRARVDSRFSLDPAMLKARPHMQEITYGLDCSLESLGAAKLVVWYCPTRAEGMAEIRILER